MAGHRAHTDLYVSCEANENQIDDPGDGNTLMIDRTDFLCILTVATTETRYLPKPTNLPLGLKGWVVNSSASANVGVADVTGQKLIGTTAAGTGNDVATLGAGEAMEVMVSTHGQSTRHWVIIGSVGEISVA